MLRTFPYVKVLLESAFRCCSVESFRTNISGVIYPWLILLNLYLRTFAHSFVSFLLFSSFSLSSFPLLFFVWLLCLSVIPNSPQDSSSGGGRSTPGRNSSPVRYGPPYNITTYLRDYRAYFNTDLAAKLLSAGPALLVPFGTGFSYSAPQLGRKGSVESTGAVTALCV